MVAAPHAGAARHQCQCRRRHAWKTPQFWMLWVVLCMNVSAGIGILGQASPMIQDMFRVTPAAAAGYVGPALHLQPRRAFLLVRRLGSHRAQGDSTASTSSSVRCCMPACRWTQGRARCHALRRGHRPHHHDVWRRLCHHSGLPARHVRQLSGRRHPRPAHHRLDRRRHPRTATRRPHLPVDKAGRHTRRARLQWDLLPDGRTACHRACRQSAGASGGSKAHLAPPTQPGCAEETSD